FKRLHAEIRLFRGEFAAGKAARITGIVDNPHTHIALFRFLHELAEEVEILRREVSEWCSESGLHGDGLKPKAVQGVEVAIDLCNADRAIQSEVWLGSVLGLRRLPLCRDIGCREILHVLPRLLRETCSGAE